MTIFIFG